MRGYAERVNWRKSELPSTEEQDMAAERISLHNPYLSEQDIAARDQHLEAIRCGCMGVVVRAGDGGGPRV